MTVMLKVLLFTETVWVLQYTSSFLFLFSFF